LNNTIFYCISRRFPVVAQISWAIKQERTISRTSRAGRRSRENRKTKFAARYKISQVTDRDK